jgi:hypothetical protein
VLELLQAGASPLLPVPQSVPGIAGFLRTLTAHTAKNAAEYALRIGRPFILGMLLTWDERDAARRQSRRYTFDVTHLTDLAQAAGNSVNTSEIRDVLESAASRRLRARRMPS